MKKTHILDVLQVTAALLITSGMVAYAAPLPQKVTPPSKDISITKPVSKPAAPIVAAVQPVSAPKAVIWQDNPNHCSDAQYIAQDAPFGCIDKPVAVASAPVTAAQPVSAVVAGCGDNEWAQYIYQHESGCNLNAVNSGGCRGIGQACPGSKLPCGADYACQNAYFTDYANSRYGGWQQAYNFWVNNHWW